MQAARRPLRRALDALYAASGALAAIFLAVTCVVMLLQVAGGSRESSSRGADDIVAWACAASVFLALGHTFRKGELIRVGCCSAARAGPRAAWPSSFRSA